MCRFNDVVRIFPYGHHIAGRRYKGSHGALPQKRQTASFNPARGIRMQFLTVLKAAYEEWAKTNVWQQQMSIKQTKKLRRA